MGPSVCVLIHAECIGVAKGDGGNAQPALNAVSEDSWVKRPRAHPPISVDQARMPPSRRPAASKGGESSFVSPADTIGLDMLGSGFMVKDAV